MPVKCDICGIFCSSLDAIATEEGFVFCGSVRGNGCAQKYDNGEFEIDGTGDFENPFVLSK